MKKILLTIAFLLFTSTSFAAFEKSSTLPSILIDVDCFGEYELIPKYLEDFKDILSGELNNTNKFNVILSSNEDTLTVIHMNAIAHSHIYQRELANAPLIKYADSIKGRAYYQNETQTAQRLKLIGQPFFLSDDVFIQLKTINQSYNANYFFFVNLRDVDIWRKGGLFYNRPENINLRGKKAKFEIEFYLINTKSGEVFEGQNFEKSTSLSRFNIGDNFTIQDMMQSLMERQAKDIVKFISSKKLKGK